MRRHYNTFLTAATLVLLSTPSFATVAVSGTINRTYPADQCGNITSSCPCSPSTLTVTVAVRYATVEIRNNSNANLATTFTDGSGHFATSVSALNAGSTFKLIVWAQTAAAEIRDVSNSALIGVQYSETAQATTPLAITIDSSVDAGVPNIRPALNVMDSVVRGYQ